MNKLELLVNHLRSFPDELSWVEFKHDNYDPIMIGEDICALANAAVLSDRSHAYMIWGIHDKTHDIIGTNHDLQSLKKGSQELENWLRFLLSKNIDFTFEKVPMENKEGDKVLVGVLTISPSIEMPAMFEKTEFIRVGSYTKKLYDFPKLKTRLWDKLRKSNAEVQIAMPEISSEDVFKYLDVNAYYSLLDRPKPGDANTVIHDLQEDSIISESDTGLWNITNAGALLLAKKLSYFKSLSRMAVRVITHKGTDRLQMLKDETFDCGYALSFENILLYLNGLLPSEEIILPTGKRERLSSFPMLAIREALANMCIHQELLLRGTSLLIEIFSNRVELTNPGTLLIDLMRILDNPPRSRNEKIASLMRRFKFCEEAGSGWDKMVIECENMNLPSPKVIQYEESTKIIIWNKVPFAYISPEDKYWATYLHTCMRFLSNEACTNTSLRERFGLSKTQQGPVSRLIKECIEKGFIKPLDPFTAPRYMSYIPFWA